MKNLRAKNSRIVLKNVLETLFERAKARMLGKFYNGPKIFIQVIKDFGLQNSLEGAHRHTLMHTLGPGIDPDTEILDAQMDEVDSLIDSLKAKTYKEALQALKTKDPEKIKDVFVSATKHIDMITNTEIRRTQSFAEDDAVYQIARSKGIQDPTVIFIGFHDLKTCKFCEAMYHCKTNPKIPRAHKMSQIVMGEWFKPKNWNGKAIYNTPLHPRCFDNKTEVLTNEGWKFFKDLNKSETILSVDLDSGNAEFLKPTQYISFHYQGEMDYFHNNRVSLVTTPNHHHPIQYRKNKGPKALEGKTTLQCGHSLRKSDWNFIATIPNWEGESQPIIKFGKEYDAKLFVQFLGFYISEGSLYKNFKRDRIAIAQSPKKYQKEMAEVCEKLFGKIWVYGDKIIIPTPDDYLIAYLKALGHSHQKYIPQNIKNLSKSYLELFLKSFCMGDGSTRSGRMCFGTPAKTEIVYHTSSPRLASDLGELILKCGFKPSYTSVPPKTVKHRNGTYTGNHTCWVIRQCRQTSHHIGSMKREKILYSDMVYDVELPKSHTLFVRHSGKVLLSGNCRHSKTLLLQGFGFDQSGSLKYIGANHDEYAAQKARGDTE